MSSFRVNFGYYARVLGLSTKLTDKILILNKASTVFPSINRRKLYQYLQAL